MSAEQPGAATPFELVLVVPEAAIEAVGEALDALDALSVSVEDADAIADQIVASRDKVRDYDGGPEGTADRFRG